MLNQSKLIKGAKRLKRLSLPSKILKILKAVKALGQLNSRIKANLKRLGQLTCHEAAKMLSQQIMKYKAARHIVQSSSGSQKEAAFLKRLCQPVLKQKRSTKTKTLHQKT